MVFVRTLTFRLTSRYARSLTSSPFGTYRDLSCIPVDCLNLQFTYFPYIPPARAFCRPWRGLLIANTGVSLRLKRDRKVPFMTAMFTMVTAHAVLDISTPIYLMPVYVSETHQSSVVQLALQVLLEPYWPVQLHGCDIKLI